MRGTSGKFTEAAFSRLPAQPYRGAEIRDKMGKGFSWANLGSFVHVHHDLESHLVSTGGRKLGKEWRGTLVGAACGVARWCTLG